MRFGTEGGGSFSNLQPIDIKPDVDQAEYREILGERYRLYSAAEQAEIVHVYLESVHKHLEERRGDRPRQPYFSIEIGND